MEQIEKELVYRILYDTNATEFGAFRNLIKNHESEKIVNLNLLFNYMCKDDQPKNYGIDSVYSFIIEYLNDCLMSTDVDDKYGIELWIEAIQDTCRFISTDINIILASIKNLIKQYKFEICYKAVERYIYFIFYYYRFPEKHYYLFQLYDILSWTFMYDQIKLLFQKQYFDLTFGSYMKYQQLRSRPIKNIYVKFKVNYSETECSIEKEYYYKIFNSSYWSEQSSYWCNSEAPITMGRTKMMNENFVRKLLRKSKFLLDNNYIITLNEIYVPAKFVLIKIGFFYEIIDKANNQILKRDRFVSLPDTFGVINDLINERRVNRNFYSSVLNIN